MLSLQTFTSLVQNMAAAVQGTCSTLVNLSTGSVLRAILQASASVALWLQWLLVLLMNRQRLVTSSGADVDTFINDFGMTRLPAVVASGVVTFARFSPASAATIPPGVVVMTAPGGTQFQVVTDTTNALWNAAAGAYIIPAGTASGSVPCQCVTAGTAGNVQAGAITTLGTAVAGVDTVTNPSAFTGGLSAQSDASVKASFVGYIGSLARATPAAVAYAISSVQQGLTWVIQENMLPGGAYRPGNFLVTVDDGSGSPPSSVLAAVYTAVNAVRPIGSTFTVQGPTPLNAAVAVTLTVAPGVLKASVTGTVAAAISAYVDALPVGGTLSYTALAAAIYAALPAGQITNLSGYTINGSAADLVPTATQVIKAVPSPVVS